MLTGKAAGDDKKLGKALEKQYKEEAKAEPTSPVITPTPLGDLSAPATRRLLINLIATLNASFPDYDFKWVAPPCAFPLRRVVSVVMM